MAPIALILAASPAIGLILVALLVVVVVGIRQEPSTAELRSQPPTRLAALVRRVHGVSVRRPDQQAKDDGRKPESCFVGQTNSSEER